MNVEKVCFNCGLPGARVRAKVTLKAENSFKRKASKVLDFCSEECGVQTMFLQLPVVSDRHRIARILHGKAIRYSEFRKGVRLERVDGGQTVTKTPSRTRINSGSNEGENAELIPEAHEGFLSRGGRPRKYRSDSERRRAHAERQRAYRQAHSAGR